VLHDYIQEAISATVEYLGRKVEPIKEWEALLVDYEVPFSKAEIGEDDSYADYLEAKIHEHVVDQIVNETFQILFSDRQFCLKFNLFLSEIVQDTKKSDWPDHLEKDGVLKRCTYFPTWVERAVFMRDRGNCAVCLKDLTGVLKTNPEKAIDHIVPLALGGCNDITNLQLICQTCNNNKLGHTVTTSQKYPVYF
jgi:hypothetical protein